MNKVRVDRELSVADRVRLWRSYRGLSVPECAHRAGVTESWWRRVERGQIPMLRLADLVTIRHVVDADLDALTGSTDVAFEHDRDREHPLLPPVRTAVARTNSPSLLERDPISLDILAERVGQANTVFHDSRHYITELGTLLPDLLLDTARAHHVAPTEQRRAAARLLGTVTVLGIDWCRQLAAYELADLLADRAAFLARDAHDPVLTGLVCWQTAGLLKDEGKIDEAIETCQRGLAVLEPTLADGPTDNLAIYGHLRLQRGLSAAHADDPSTALTALADGARIARQLGDHHIHPVSRFGRAHVDVFTVRTLIALGDARGALRAADLADITAMPDTGTRARAFIDIARGYLARRDDTAALKVFELAEREAPETIAHSVHVREGLRAMLRRDRRTIGPDLRAMAHRVGLDTAA